jgi:trehalose/maltose hydrolase-like predicted phosphorylase
MNVLSKMVMTAAIKCAQGVNREYPDIWQDIATHIVIPVDPKYNIVVQFDGAIPEPGGARYAPGMMQLLLYHDPMEYDAIDVALFRRTYEFEEELRLKIPPHPSNPLSVKAPGFTTPPFAACAAFFGDRKKAADQFRHAWEKYWVKPYGVTKEYQHYKEGEYLMNHAALLQAAMYVFTGLRVREGEWNKYPAAMPEGWQKIEIDRLWIKGKQVRVVAEHGKPALIYPLANQDKLN